VTATTPASATPQGALAVQQQLQTLNNSLAALGLSAADIQKVDQVAGLINDFSPTAFTSLVYQLEAVGAERSATGCAGAEREQQRRKYVGQREPAGEGSDSGPDRHHHDRKYNHRECKRRKLLRWRDCNSS